MGFIKCLDCSTAHLAPRDVDILKNLATEMEDAEISYSIPRVANHAYGMTLFFGSLEEGTENEEYEMFRKECAKLGIGDSLEALLKYARANDCYMINLDGDGDVIDGLPTHEW